MNLSNLKQKVKKFPQNPGVYFFSGEKGKILYIGKATNLRSRVQSYFRSISDTQRSDLLGIEVGPRLADVAGRSEWIGNMIPLVVDVDFQETDSVLEALILESNLIKKHQPKYNVKEKDDKSFSYFVITKEEFPRVLILRKTDLDKAVGSKRSDLLGIEVRPRTRFGDIIVAKKFGPYTSKNQMQVALKIIRKIFPFHSNKQPTEKGCLDFQIGLCPGPYASAISKEDYQKNIRGIKMILEGKKKRLVTALEKEMNALAKKNEFEKAANLRNKVFALRHIRDIALMGRDFEEKSPVTSHQSSEGIRNARIEAYDISNISGTNAVGSMVVFTNNKSDKSQYRKFKIKTVVGSDDVGMMREVLSRRFRHSLSCREYATSSPEGRGGIMKKTFDDWAVPELILLDGGQGHLNMAEKLLRNEMGLDVVIASVAKGPDRKNVKIQTLPTGRQVTNSKQITNVQISNEINKILEDKNLVKQIMDEAHRFAIGYHRKLRRKSALE